MKKGFTFIAVLCLIALANQSWAQTEYEDALSWAKTGEQENAFGNFSLLAKDNQSRYREQALFATAEYYFSVNDYTDAFDTFGEFLAAYPESGLRQFALFYLLKIARYWKQETLAKKIEQEIVNLKHIILVFKEKQDYKVTTPMNTALESIYYIDKVQFFVNGKIQEEILF